ncbi:MAG: phosphoribosyl-ATP pyrophosphohydrolase [Edafosvirus sp.]|uniref:Phosphoribosyl-ATP pyrophosphohydrolase n=1 Tax=Edafosvirus sp. TaxID=2487765 RepID=A0A3G4ZTW7_9VIRU|nr:MAG: phosphoribosyl-ATP pyrophosphohydrolase [Edafosvirus sp.]
MTNFEKVVDFNKSFGVTIHETPQHNIFTNDPKLVKFRYDLIAEEVSELSDAIKQNNFVEVTDALSDILYVVYGAGASFGIDLDKAFDIVHRSNMSKLCQTEDEAKETVEWYKKNESRYDSPTYRKSDNGKYWVVYNASTSKILKSINYVPANFDSLLSSPARAEPNLFLTSSGSPSTA